MYAKVGEASPYAGRPGLTIFGLITLRMFSGMVAQKNRKIGNSGLRI